MTGKWCTLAIFVSVSNLQKQSSQGDQLADFSGTAFINDLPCNPVCLANCKLLDVE